MWRSLSSGKSSYSNYQGTEVDFDFKSNDEITSENTFYNGVIGQNVVSFELDGYLSGGNVVKSGAFNLVGNITTEPGYGLNRLLIHIPSHVSEVNFYGDVFSGNGQAREIVIVADYNPNFGRGPVIRFRSLVNGKKTLNTNDPSERNTVQATIYAPHSDVHIQNFVGAIVARKIVTSGIFIVDQDAQDFLVNELTGIGSYVLETGVGVIQLIRLRVLFVMMWLKTMIPMMPNLD